ncbi:hypothetical protein MRX96_015472 [Rhipicephalus microplus]
MTPADDLVTERKGPDPASSPTSATFTEFVGQHKRNEWSHKHEFLATASPRDQTRRPSFIRAKRIGETKCRLLVEDTDLERKTTAAAAGPASFQPNASLKRLPAPVEDTSLERKTPAAAGGLTSADSNAFVKQHRSGMKHYRNHEISTSASAKHQKVVVPIFLAVAIVAILGAIIFTIVVRGHHAFKPFYLKNTANASGTVTPAE